MFFTVFVSGAPPGPWLIRTCFRVQANPLSRDRNFDVPDANQAELWTLNQKVRGRPDAALGSESNVIAITGKFRYHL